MSYYRLDENDHSRSSWLLFTEGNVSTSNRLPPKLSGSSLPPVISKLLGPQPEGPLCLKGRYVSLCCKICGRYSEDEVFDAGFEEPVTIRIQGDFGHTSDRVFVISAKLHKVLSQAGVSGFETKPIGKGGWHALRVVNRVECSKKVIQLVKPVCRGCGRAKGAKGIFRYLTQLSVPPVGNTLFTTIASWPQLLWERDLFLTQDVVDVLRKAGIKGGYCNRLFTPSEEEEAEAKIKESPKYQWWAPKKSQIRL